MTEDDFYRHIQKINKALVQAQTYFEKTSEANAAVHGSDKVLYSPIVTTLNEAKTSLEAINQEYVTND